MALHVGIVSDIVARAWSRARKRWAAQCALIRQRASAQNALDALSSCLSQASAVSDGGLDDQRLNPLRMSQSHAKANGASRSPA